CAWTGTFGSRITGSQRPACSRVTAARSSLSLMLSAVMCMLPLAVSELAIVGRNAGMGTSPSGLPDVAHPRPDCGAELLLILAACTSRGPVNQATRRPVFCRYDRVHLAHFLPDAIKNCVNSRLPISTTTSRDVVVAWTKLIETDLRGCHGDRD